MVEVDRQFEHVTGVLEQLAKDLDLASVNIQRLLKQQNKPTPLAMWDPHMVKWTEDVGKKGPYERSEDTENANFKAMAKDLQEHDSKLTRDGRFYWLFTGGKAVGRTLPK